MFFIERCNLACKVLGRVVEEQNLKEWKRERGRRNRVDWKVERIKKMKKACRKTSKGNNTGAARRQ